MLVKSICSRYLRCIYYFPILFWQIRCSIQPIPEDWPLKRCQKLDLACAVTVARPLAHCVDPYLLPLVCSFFLIFSIREHPDLWLGVKREAPSTRQWGDDLLHRGRLCTGCFELYWNYFQILAAMLDFWVCNVLKVFGGLKFRAEFGDSEMPLVFWDRTFRGIVQILTHEKPTSTEYCG